MNGLAFVVVVVDMIVLFPLTVPVDRIYRWYGARMSTRLLIWSIPILGAILIALAYLGEVWIGLAVATIAILAVLRLAPRQVIRVTGGQRKVVAFGEVVGELGRLALEFRNEEEHQVREQAAARIRSLLPSLEQYRDGETSEYIELFTQQINAELNGSAADLKRGVRLHELSSAYRRRLDSEGVGPFSWYWAANTDARGREGASGAASPHSGGRPR